MASCEKVTASLHLAAHMCSGLIWELFYIAVDEFWSTSLILIQPHWKFFFFFTISFRWKSVLWLGQGLKLMARKSSSGFSCRDEDSKQPLTIIPPPPCFALIEMLFFWNAALVLCRMNRTRTIQRFCLRLISVLTCNAICTVYTYQDAFSKCETSLGVLSSH